MHWRIKKGGGGYGRCNHFENSKVKKSDKAKQKTEEMKREKEK